MSAQFDQLYEDQKAWLARRQKQIEESDVRERIDLSGTDREGLADLTRVLREVVELERAKTASLHLENAKLSARVTLYPDSAPSEINPVFKGNFRLGNCHFALRARFSKNQEFINVDVTVL